MELHLYVGKIEMPQDEFTEVYLSTTMDRLTRDLAERLRQYYGEYDQHLLSNIREDIGKSLKECDYDDLLEIGIDYNLAYIQINYLPVSSDDHILTHVMETV
jgi:hypothetical protein